MRPALSALVLTLLSVFSAAAAAPDFERDVAPLLLRHCVDCHSGAAPKGGLDLTRRKAALAQIDPGKPDDSPLWQRVRDDEMPPKKPLSAADKAMLHRWLAAGARWGRDPIDPFRVSTDSRAGYDWWSLRPVVAPVPPPVTDARWPRTPIDRFVLSRLEARGLTPSPEADRRTLLRRLSFDLLGLPPTPEEIEAFQRDSRPDAYERIVDRLLASPAHGERWGRHWLDVVRFGESDGFERDLPRPNAWPYRDWVVSALNADLPYDEFARLQLAGDVRRPGEAAAATGFLVAGPHDIVVPVSAAMREAMRQDELEDTVGTLGQTFLGLTVHCARCHDHKFDPIAQIDYYRLAAAVAGVRHGERPVPVPGLAARADRLRDRLRQLHRDIDHIDDPVRRHLLAEQRPTAAPLPLAEWDFTVGLEDRRGTRDGKAYGGARRDSGGLHLDGQRAYVATGPVAKDLGEKTLEAWVRLDNLTQRGGGVLGVQTLDGTVFDAVVFGEQEPGRWMAGSEFFRRTASFAGPVETRMGGFVHVAVSYAANGTVTAYRDGVPYGKPYAVAAPTRFRAGTWQVVLGLRHGPPGGNRLLAGMLRRARLYDRALSGDEIAASAGRAVVRPEQIEARLSASARARRRALLDEQKQLMDELARLEPQLHDKLYTAVSAQPEPTRLLLRGNVGSPAEVVAPGPLAALAEALGARPLAADAPEGQRRAALASWISDPKNPLFRRVLVNRLWQYHFGVGLVDTPSDFGFNGGRPGHPELLDWLADELLRRGWGLKALHRLIVTSAAYRQESRPRPEALRLDADNRLLWRMTPRRLEAEAVRDATLWLSGTLDRQIGGPPYHDFRSTFFKGTQFYEPIEQVGPAFTRRSLYRMWARGGRNPFLDTFDCPDPSATTPRRAVTTTPLQALALFNNAFVLHQADQVARRLHRETGDDPQRQIERLCALAYGRPPQPRERALLRGFLERHSLAALCRVVLNTAEFVQVD